MVEGSAHAGHNTSPAEEAPESTPAVPEVAVHGMTSTDTVVVSLVDDRSEPSWIEIPVGTTVTWVNNGADWHNVASSKAGFASDRILPGESFSFTFEEPGEYKVVCRHHGLAGMTGTVVVTN